MKRQLLLLISFFQMSLLCTYAQQWQGMTGLLHVPNAEMDSVGDASIGIHMVNKEMLPDIFSYEDGNGNAHRYNSIAYYLSVTPFTWLQLSYCCVMFKNDDGSLKGFNNKDRHLALKVNALREGNHWPSIALGMDDILGTNFNEGQYTFGNAWLAMTKHIDINKHEIGVTLAGRYYFENKNKPSRNKRFRGLVGGLTYRPSFFKPMRLLVESDGQHFNMGADVKFWNHWLVQASLHGFKYPSVGLAYHLNLLYKNKKLK